MTHDEMMSLLANTLADAAGHAGCLPILDCFSPHPGEEVTVSIPMCDDTVDIVLEDLDFPHEWETSVYKGYKQDKIEMRGDRAEMSDFPLYLNTVAGGLDRRDQTIGGFSFVVKIYAVPVVEIIG